MPICGCGMQSASYEDGAMNLRESLGKRGLLLVAAGGALLLGYGAYQLWWGNAALPDGLIQANGRIEGDQVMVASKFGGRIAQVEAREGDTVTAGQVLVRLDDSQVRAQVTQARAGVAALGAQVRAAASREQQAQRDAERFRGLGAEGTVSVYELEQAELARSLARDQRLQAQAQERNARAALAEAESVLADLTVRAPIVGTVTARMADLGEVVGAGAPLLTVVDLDRLYLKVYVPEIEIGRLRLGLPARVHIDALPDQPYPATVRYIAAQAEFTPKEVQTRDERVKLVYAVKLYLEANPDHRLTPGLPADAVIRWKDDVAWMPPRH